MKLNLGCGDKILPGYVNVDVAPTRAGQKPDVICDLHKLEPFQDAAADEVLAVHVVEHFWRWEVVDVLREWARVLKPGAPMILECPNLQPAHDVGVLRRPALARSPDGAPLGLHAEEPRAGHGAGRAHQHPPGARAVQAARAARPRIVGNKR